MAELKNGKLEIEITTEEAYELAYTLKYELNRSIDSHYNVLQQNKDGEGVFFEYEERRLNLMKFFYGLCGRAELYQQEMNAIKKKFEDKRIERLNGKPEKEG